MDDSSSVVQLAHIDDVPELQLEGPGTIHVENLLAGADTSRAVRSALDQLPAEGWRMLKVAFGGGRHKEVWGCPSGLGWWVLTVNHIRGVRSVLVEPEPVEPIPARRRRADGLALRWATTDAVTVRQAALSQFSFAVELSNTTLRQWTNTADDSDLVMIVPNGIESYHIDSPATRLPSIAAGDSYRLTAYYTSGPLPPGTYELRAGMPDLGLRTENPISLFVTG